jgi:hypothetical protein
MASRLESELRELVLALALFLAGLGYAVSGLPANIVVGCVIWGLAWIFITHLFFVSEITASCPIDVKLIFWGAVTCLVVLLLSRPVEIQYAKEHAHPMPSQPSQPLPESSKPAPPIPASPPQRSYLVFTTAGFEFPSNPPAIPEKDFLAGNELFFNAHIKSTGPNPIDVLHVTRWLYSEPNYEHKTQVAMIDDFKKKVRKYEQVSAQPITMMSGDTFFLAFMM